MKELIKHLFKEHLQEIVSKSYLNCHAFGVHSIMLLDSPEKTIRLYYAEAGHDLGRNLPVKISKYTKLSVGFHPHHCNLTLVVVKGMILNWTIKNVDYETPFSLSAYRYNSEITNGKIGFKKLSDKNYFINSKKSYLGVGDSIRLQANEIHTIAADPEYDSAWLVFEGKEDSLYNNITYSDNDLEEIQTVGMYKKPTGFEVENILQACNLLDS